MVSKIFFNFLPVIAAVIKVLEEAVIVTVVKVLEVVVVGVYVVAMIVIPGGMCASPIQKGSQLDGSDREQPQKA